MRVPSSRLTLLLLILIALPLRAAEPAVEAPAAESESAANQATTAEDASDTAAIEAEDPALAEEIRVAEAAAANAPPVDRNEPFIPSVQISEDLSVSFPVDI